MGFKLLTFGTIVSVLIAAIGLTGIFVSDKLIHSIVTSSVKLVPGSLLFKQWLNPPIDVYINFYLFDIKNGDDFEKKAAKPIFEEVGPIVYKEYVVKENLTSNLDGTLTYVEKKYYIFSPELSKIPENYTITTLNMAAITIISQIKYQREIVHSAVNLALQGIGETLLIKKTIKEIMFGYEDEFLKILKTIVPNLVPTDIIGLFIGKNNTADGLYTIYTGEDDYKKIGIVKAYNNQEILNTWTTKYANMINGTDGTLIAPFVTENQTIYIFVNDLCRSLYTVYSDTIYTYHNIKLLGFSPDAKFFQNASQNPDNAGFCTPAGNCLPAGVLNLTLCLQGIPIVQSSPHFLFCDEKFINDVVGIKPDYNSHRTQLYVEPTSGVLMKANKRIQFNTQLFKDPRITITKNLPEVLYPLMWVDENFIIDKKNADIFYNQAQLPLDILNYGKYVLLGVGLVLLTLHLIYYLRKKAKDNSYSNIDVQDSIINNSQASETTHLIL